MTLMDIDYRQLGQVSKPTRHRLRSMIHYNDPNDVSQPICVPVHRIPNVLRVYRYQRHIHGSIDGKCIVHERKASPPTYVTQAHCMYSVCVSLQVRTVCFL